LKERAPNYTVPPYVRASVSEVLRILSFLLLILAIVAASLGLVYGASFLSITASVCLPTVLAVVLLVLARVLAQRERRLSLLREQLLKNLAAHIPEAKCWVRWGWLGIIFLEDVLLYLSVTPSLAKQAHVVMTIGVTARVRKPLQAAERWSPLLHPMSWRWRTVVCIHNIWNKKEIERKLGISALAYLEPLLKNQNPTFGRTAFRWLWVGYANLAIPDPNTPLVRTVERQRAVILRLLLLVDQPLNMEPVLNLVRYLLHTGKTTKLLWRGEEECDLTCFTTRRRS